MEPHQQRVVDENKELNEKIDKLYIFMHTDKFKSLDKEEIDRLRNQFSVMNLYSQILEQRISAFISYEKNISK